MYVLMYLGKFVLSDYDVIKVAKWSVPTNYYKVENICSICLISLIDVLGHSKRNNSETYTYIKLEFF